MENKKKDTETFAARLAARYRQPSPSDTVILRGQSDAAVYGCKKILLYSPQRICLGARKRMIILSGEGMICSSFSGGTVTVKGRINRVSFEKPNGKGEWKESEK